MKPTNKTHANTKMDFNRPRSLDYAHVWEKLNPSFLEDTRFASIEWENALLAKKMISIHSRDRNTVMPVTKVIKPGARIDRNQYPLIDCFQTGQLSSSKERGQASGGKSLNKDKRRRDFQRVLDENAALYGRIEAAEASYGREQLLRSASRQAAYGRIASKHDRPAPTMRAWEPAPSTSGQLLLNASEPQLRMNLSPGQGPNRHS